MIVLRSMFLSSLTVLFALLLLEYKQFYVQTTMINSNANEYPLEKSPYNEINIFFVPHSHTDPGWIETLEVYYTTQVRDILNNVFKELINDEGKRFTWGETCFLKMYYDEASDEQREKITTVINRGQIEIVGGGWVQHDETLTAYAQQIANIETGQLWLEKTFPSLKENVKVLWQIDPFGSSETTPLIFNSEQQSTGIKFEYAVINRIGDQIKNEMKQNQSMDFYWHNQYSEGRLLTHVLHNHYETLHFDVYKKIQQQEQNYNDKTVASLLREFNHKIIRPQISKQRHRNIMILIGSDFAYVTKGQRSNQYDVSTFKTLDSVMEILNLRSLKHLGFKVNAGYATPSDYFKSLQYETHQNSLVLPTMHMDFSHYDEQFHLLHPEFDGKNRIDYWTGYFSNRPVLKAAIYKSLNYYLNSMTFANVAQILIEQTPEYINHILMKELGNSTNLDELESYQYLTNSEINQKIEEIGQIATIGTHHDTLPSTSRSFVHDSEITKFKDSIDLSQKLIANQFINLFNGRKVVNKQTNKNVTQFLLINSQAYIRSQIIKIPTTGKYSAVKFNNKYIKSETQPQFVCIYQQVQFDNSYQIVARVEYEPLSVGILEIQEYHNSDECQKEHGNRCSAYAKEEKVTKKQQVTVENEKIKIRLNNKNYMIEEMTFKDQDLTIEMLMNVVRYNNINAESGAYIFAPSEPAVDLNIKPLDIYMIKSEIQTNIVIFYKSIYKYSCFGLFQIAIDHIGENQDNPIFKFKSFPLESDDLYLRIKTNLTQSSLWTYNSLYNIQRQNEKRFISYRDLGKFFYPSVASSSLQSQDKFLTFHNGDKPVGVGMIKDGELQIGLGRKNKYNDDKGLPDGVQEMSPLILTLSIGMYEFKNIESNNEFKVNNDILQNPILLIQLNDTFKFESYGISFGKIGDINNQLITLRYDIDRKVYRMKLLAREFNYLPNREMLLTSDLFDIDQPISSDLIDDELSVNNEKVIDKTLTNIKIHEFDIINLRQNNEGQKLIKSLDNVQQDKNCQ